MTAIEKYEADIERLKTELALLNGELEVAKGLALTDDQPMSELIAKRIEVQAAIEITEERFKWSEQNLIAATQSAELDERKRTRDSVCSVTDTMVAEVRKLDAVLKRGAKHYRKVLEADRELRELAPGAEGLPQNFLGSSPGEQAYNWLVTAVSKHFDLPGMNIHSWPTQIDFEQRGTPELAYAGQLDLNDQWRNPQPQVEEEAGWREATEEEIANVAS
jgi:hypothetical protein